MNAEVRLGIARLALTALPIFCLGGEWMSTQRPPILPVSQEELRGLGFPFPPRAVFIDGYDLVPARRTDILAFRFRLPAEDFPAFLRSLGFPSSASPTSTPPAKRESPSPRCSSSRRSFVSSRAGPRRRRSGPSRNASSAASIDLPFPLIPSPATSFWWIGRILGCIGSMWFGGTGFAEAGG
jgi:hypothetical protein